MQKSRTHTLKGSKLQVKYADDEEFEPNKISLHPSQEMDPELLEMYLESTLNMTQPADFSVEAIGLSAVITFNKDYSEKGT